MAPTHLIPLHRVKGDVADQVFCRVAASHLIAVEPRTPQLAHLLAVQTATRLAALLPFRARLPRTRTGTEKSKHTCWFRFNYRRLVNANDALATR